MGQCNQMQKKWITCRKQKVAKGSENHRGKFCLRPVGKLFYKPHITKRGKGHEDRNQTEEERCLQQPKKGSSLIVFVKHSFSVFTINSKHICH